jgi:uncharacterized protein (TIGR03067 family)
MQFRMFVIVAMAVGLTGLTGCKSKDQADAEKAAIDAEIGKLQGKWKIASRQEDAEDADDKPDPGDLPAFIVNIKGDIMEFTFRGEVDYRQKLTIIPNKDPKQVDLTYVDASGKPETATTTKKSLTGKKKKTTTTLKDVGIYSIDGDTLKFCISFDEKKRPTDFTVSPKSARYLLTLQRIKDDTPPQDDKKDVKNDDKKDDMVEKAKVERAKSEMQTILRAVKKYYAEHQEWPDLNKLQTTIGPMIEENPTLTDPWGGQVHCPNNRN